MTEEEYWDSDPDRNDDDEIIGEYLIDEVDDNLTLTMFPKIQYDFETEFEVYYKLLKKCRTKEQMRDVLSGIVSHVSSFAILEHEIDHLQDKAQDLEFKVRMLQQQGYT